MSSRTHRVMVTSADSLPSLTLGEEPQAPADHELARRYRGVVEDQRLNWTTHHRLLRLLGKGGQGAVYLSERRGADGFTLPVALKIYSPENFPDPKDYDEAMRRAADMAVRVAQIQHDSLLDVQDFVDRNQLRILVMEWIDGYDLSRMLDMEWMPKVRERTHGKRWDDLNRIVVTQGPVQARFMPGVAVAIVKECLGALAAMHREGLVHGDIKPANLMLKCTGHAKIIDIGSAFSADDPPPTRTVTPAFAACEVLEGAPVTQRSDLASLGYVLVELLSGRKLCSGVKEYRKLLEFKRSLPAQLDQLLPGSVTVNATLMSFIRGLIAPDPAKRYASAEAADLDRGGATSILQQLVLGDLASEYVNELRLLMTERKSAEEGA